LRVLLTAITASPTHTLHKVIRVTVPGFWWVPRLDVFQGRGFLFDFPCLRSQGWKIREQKFAGEVQWNQSCPGGQRCHFSRKSSMYKASSRQGVSSCASVGGRSWGWLDGLRLAGINACRACGKAGRIRRGHRCGDVDGVRFESKASGSLQRGVRKRVRE